MQSLSATKKSKSHASGDTAHAGYALGELPAFPRAQAQTQTQTQPTLRSGFARQLSLLTSSAYRRAEKAAKEAGLDEEIRSVQAKIEIAEADGEANSKSTPALYYKAFQLNYYKATGVHATLVKKLRLSGRKAEFEFKGERKPIEQVNLLALMRSLRWIGQHVALTDSTISINGCAHALANSEYNLWDGFPQGWQSCLKDLNERERATLCDGHNPWFLDFGNFVRTAREFAFAAAALRQLDEHLCPTDLSRLALDYAGAGRPEEPIAADDAATLLQADEQGQQVDDKVPSQIEGFLGNIFQDPPALSGVNVSLVCGYLVESIRARSGHDHAQLLEGLANAMVVTRDHHGSANRPGVDEALSMHFPMHAAKFRDPKTLITNALAWCLKQGALLDHEDPESELDFLKAIGMLQNVATRTLDPASADGLRVEFAASLNQFARENPLKASWAGKAFVCFPPGYMHLRVVPT